MSIMNNVNDDDISYRRTGTNEHGDLKNKERSHIKDTISLCPECLGRVSAEVFAEDGCVFIEKECPTHGMFKDVYWTDVELYRKFDRYHAYGTGVSNPAVNGKDQFLGCGLCHGHKTSTILANIDITNRCNLNCPVCFANARKSGRVYEPSIGQIRDMLVMLRSQKPIPCYAVQFSGGEPTVRDDLPDIIKMAHDLGFEHIQIATNGLRLAKDVSFARTLNESGLCTVYLSFDGIGEEPYRKMRGIDAFPIKTAAIDNCQKAGLTSVALVPTLERGVNDHQIGDIVNFASGRMDVVKAVNFQPVAFTGRIDQTDREAKRITIPDLLHLMEEQTNGVVAIDDWFPVPAAVIISRFMEAVLNRKMTEFSMHPHCGAATYLFKESNELIPITRFVDVEGLLEHFEERTSLIRDAGSHVQKAIQIRRAVHNISDFIDIKQAPKSVNVTRMMMDFFTKGTSEAMKPFHRNSLFLGAMHFQDPYNLDVDRVQRCGIHYATPDGRIIPFCSYNTMHRQAVEARFSCDHQTWKEQASRVVEV